MKRVVAGSIVIVAAALLLAVSFVASINEYRRVFGAELADAYDCDGPTSVLVFLAPSLVLAVTGILLLGRSRRRGIAIGVLILLLGVARLVPTLAEERRNAASLSPCR